MATKTISLRIDSDLYRRFSEFCDKVYVAPSALFSAFAARTVAEQKVPFEIASDPFYSTDNQARLLAAIAQLESGKGTSHDLIEE